MDISAATWNTVSKLLDEALDLEPAARAVWFEQLSATQPALAPSVRKLLAAHASSETNDVFSKLPPLPQGANHETALSPGDRVGPYRLKRELGAGGMADVWLAERADGAFTRDVALKLPMLSRLRRDLAQRFARERDILARLEHPNIARLYDAGVSEDGLPYLAMEYVDGQAITEYCDANKLGVEARLTLFGQVLDAVQFAHANLVIHRDLKPSNILVTEDGQVRLLDFGIAKLLSDDATAHETHLTQLSGRALTPGYASPEQIKGQPLTIATDIYSLGVVLYELLAGSPPYRLKVQSAAQLEQAIVNAEPARLTTGVTADAAIARGTTRARLVKSLGGDLDTIVLKALSKSSTERYATASEFAQDLLNHRAGLPVQAQPASWTYRAYKFVMRNRMAVTAATAITVALVVASVVSLSQAQVAREQALRANEVKQFVLSIFKNADTGQGSTRKTTAVDLLRQARDRLAASPVSEPAIKVELLTSIAFSLVGLGEYQQAVPVLEEATQLALATLGAEQAITAAAQLALGEALIETGQFQRAAPHLDAAEREMRRTGNSGELINTLRWKANLRVEEGRFDEAITLATEAVQLAESRSDATHKRAAMLAHHTLAATLISARRKGRLESASRTYELAREIYGDRLSVDLLNARSLYAYALVLEGDAKEGVFELRALVQQQIELLGPDHGDVERTFGRIGNASLLNGDPLTAIDSFRQGLRIELVKGGGRPTSDAGIFYTRLGLALANARRYEEAERELHRAVEILAPAPDSNHYDARIARSSRGFVLTRAGRLNEADAIFSQLLERSFSGPREQAVTKLRLGILRSEQGQHAEAQALIQEATGFFSNGEPVSHAVALAALGAAQIEAGGSTDALDTLMQAKATFEKLQSAASPDLADLLVNMARAQLAAGRVDEAVASAEKATAFWNSFDPINRSTGMAALWHARALVAAGKDSAAIASLHQASEILAAAGLPYDRALLKRTRHELSVRTRESRSVAHRLAN